MPGGAAARREPARALTCAACSRCTRRTATTLLLEAASGRRAVQRAAGACFTDCTALCIVAGAATDRKEKLSDREAKQWNDRLLGLLVRVMGGGSMQQWMRLGWKHGWARCSMWHGAAWYTMALKRPDNQLQRCRLLLPPCQP